MSSRMITHCHPLMQPLVHAFKENCRRDGIEILITCTWRSAQEQTELYAQGRTKPGKIVTNAKAGQSAHNFMLSNQPASLAVDVVPMRFGKPVWGLAGDGIDEIAADDAVDDLELWQRVRRAGEQVGLESASRWPTFKEWPHFQHPKTKEMMK